MLLLVLGGIPAGRRILSRAVSKRYEVPSRFLDFRGPFPEELFDHLDEAVGLEVDQIALCKAAEGGSLQGLGDQGDLEAIPAPACNRQRDPIDRDRPFLDQEAPELGGGRDPDRE